jgi:hypothetical protein
MMAWISPHRFSSLVVGLACIGLGLAGCNQQRVVKGECSSLNGADVCTWGETTGKTLTAFGATIPLASAQNAPAEGEMVWPPVAAADIPLPETVKSSTGFDHLKVYWEPHGHPPGPYLVPHFDFHFYTLSAEQVNAIDCADSIKPAQLPAGYLLPDVTIPELGTLVGLCVPKMGMHALLGSELNSSTPFEKAMVVGYDHQRPIFIEPMITRETLDAQHSFTMDVPQIPGAPSTVHYPQRFRADYDSTAKAYRFVFSDFTAGGGS